MLQQVALLLLAAVVAAAWRRSNRATRGPPSPVYQQTGNPLKQANSAAKRASRQGGQGRTQLLATGLPGHAVTPWAAKAAIEAAIARVRRANGLAASGGSGGVAAAADDDSGGLQAAAAVVIKAHWGKPSSLSARVELSEWAADLLLQHSEQLAPVRVAMWDRRCPAAMGQRGKRQRRQQRRALVREAELVAAVCSAAAKAIMEPPQQPTAVPTAPQVPAPLTLPCARLPSVVGQRLHGSSRGRTAAGSVPAPALGMDEAAELDGDDRVAAQPGSAAGPSAARRAPPSEDRSRRPERGEAPKPFVPPNPG